MVEELANPTRKKKVDRFGFRTALQVCKVAYNQELLLIPAGSCATVRFLPPLICQEEDIEQGLKRLELSLQHVFDSTRA